MGALAHFKRLPRNRVKPLIPLLENRMSTTQSPRSKRAQTGAHLGPISDLEAHLPEDWWSTLFDKLYLLTDGDVFENAENTRTDIDAIIAACPEGVPDAKLDMLRADPKGDGFIPYLVDRRIA